MRMTTPGELAVVRGFNPLAIQHFKKRPEALVLKIKSPSTDNYVRVMGS